MKFICPNNCEGSSREEYRARFSTRNGDIICRVEGESEPMTCVKCGNLLIAEPIEIIGVGHYKRIHSLPREEKQKYLKKRAHDSHLRNLKKARE